MRRPFIAQSQIVAIFLFGLACSGSPARQQTAPPAPVAQDAAEPALPPAPETPPPPPEAPALRLPNSVLPIEYRAELTIDSSKDTFTGVIEIDINILERTDHLWLHGTDIEVKSASLVARGQSWPIERLATSNEDLLGFGLGAMFPHGKATLHIEYTGMISDKDVSGIFKQKENDRWYVYTQFEATSARRAFPCFDEPRFKVPWQLTLHVREGDLAFSNTPVEKAGNEKAGAGMKTYRFARTKPLPSYLMALAVGPFEIVDLGKIGKNQTPARILVPHGRTAEARYAAEVTPALLGMLEDYFGSPYPYAKLDSVAIPHFFGAMENPGLITYNAAILLSPPDQENISFQRRYAGVGTHELAHQWFGNLVTLDWWDDVWLNESFASWMAQKLVAQWKPEWRPEIHKIERLRHAMAADSMITARQIHQPIKTKHDISSAFDAISYQKGSAVLSMFEGWIGEDAFRKGVRAYMKSHAWGTATADDFLAAIGNLGQAAAAPAVRTFLDQPGVPQVSATLNCAKGKTPEVLLSQKRFLPMGSQGSSTQTWHIPVCIKYGKGKKTAETCALLATASTTVALDQLAQGQTNTCPDWIMANKSAAGYYRVLYSGDMQSKLIKTGARYLAPAERLAVLDDMNALVETGAIDMGQALALVPALLRDKEPHVVRRAADIVSRLDGDLLPEKLRPNYQRFVRKMFSARARQLGWRGARTETDDMDRMRSSLVELAAGAGKDPVLIKQAIKLASTWLDQRKGIDNDDLNRILSTAVKNGGEAFYDRMATLLETSTETKERRALLTAMASTTNPDRVKNYFEMILSEKIPVLEAFPLLATPFFQPETRQFAYDYLKSNFERFKKAIPRRGSAFMIHAVGGFCDQAHRKDINDFFATKVEDIPGGPNALKSTLEQIDLCIAFRAGQQASIEKFLQRH